MRNFLKNLSLVGGVNVWAEGDICHYTIDNLLKYCDKVAIMMDNSDKKTTDIVMEYKNKYPQQIVIGNTNIASRVPGKSIARRHKMNSARLSECLLQLVRKEHDKKSIDLLLFLNSDEIYSSSLPDVLQKFMDSTQDVVFIQPAEVYDSFNILINKGLMSHARIYKYDPKLTTIQSNKNIETADGIAPRDYWFPHRYKRNIMRADYSFVHLQRLTKENRALRIKVKGKVATKGTKLWRVSKPAYELTPEEIYLVYSSSNFLPFEDYEGNINKLKVIC